MTSTTQTSGARNRSRTRKRERYSSPQIHERRKRILAEAQALIVEKGESGFTIQELSRRANVAPRTLYNAFGDKEGIIARATEEHYADRFNSPKYWRKKVTLTNIMYYLDKSVADIIATREYARSMVSLYFSPNANEKVYLALKHTASRIIRLWTDMAIKKNMVETWFPIESLPDRYANVFMTTIHDWLIGRIADEDLPHHVKLEFLLTIGATLKARHRAQVGRLVSTIDLHQRRLALRK
jgi:AcrR family transcriptional regulator